MKEFALSTTIENISLPKGKSNNYVIASKDLIAHIRANTIEEAVGKFVIKTQKEYPQYKLGKVNFIQIPIRKK